MYSIRQWLSHFMCTVSAHPGQFEVFQLLNVLKEKGSWNFTSQNYKVTTHVKTLLTKTALVSKQQRSHFWYGLLPARLLKVTPANIPAKIMNDHPFPDIVLLFSTAKPTQFCLNLCNPDRRHCFVIVTKY